LRVESAQPWAFRAVTTYSHTAARAEKDAAGTHGGPALPEGAVVRLTLTGHTDEAEKTAMRYA
jgi:hypothetical protein